VDKFGEVTAHKPGTANISVYSWDDAQPLSTNLETTFQRSGLKDVLNVVVR